MGLYVPPPGVVFRKVFGSLPWLSPTPFHQAAQLGWYRLFLRGQEEPRKTTRNLSSASTTRSSGSTSLSKRRRLSRNSRRCRKTPAPPRGRFAFRAKKTHRVAVRRRASRETVRRQVKTWPPFAGNSPPRSVLQCNLRNRLRGSFPRRPSSRMPSRRSPESLSKLGRPSASS